MMTSGAHKLAITFAGIIAIVASTVEIRLLRAQQPQKAALAFEVASIRIHQGPVSKIGLSISGTMITVAAYTVSDLITDGYGVKDYQLEGATGWMNSDRYDVVARSGGEGAPTRDQASLMLQTLLTERYQLKIHRATKEMSVYALEIVKNGPKLKENTTGTPMMRMSSNGRDTQMTFTRSTMEQLVMQLTHVPGVSRPVLDKTGLTGSYDFRLNLTMDPRDSSATGSDGESVFTAIGEQLGLKLVSQKAPIGIIVIDRVEKPSEN